MAGMIAAMTSWTDLQTRWRDALAELLGTLRTWPWWDTVRTLRLRFREDRLGLTAGSLTFTTLIAIVPLLTVMLAVFTAFPMFSQFQVALQKYFLQSLVPDAIAKQVLGALTQFANKSNRLGAAGLLVLLASALSLMLTIDRTLNGIWRVRKPRPIAQRVLVYWAALTLGPLALGASLANQFSASPLDRLNHAGGKSYADCARMWLRQAPPVPDWVAYPEDELVIVDILDWAQTHNVAVIPYGGGSSVCGGVEAAVGDSYAGVISLDLERLNRVLEVDPVSRAARIQAGALGPLHLIGG